jgi:ketosteroid isomerase-like protein
MTGTIEQEILTQEENFTQAQRNLDLAALDQVFADDVLFTGVTGEICGKASMLSEWHQGVAQRDAAIAQGKKTRVSFDKEDIKVVTYGDIGVSAYRFIIRIQDERLDILRRYRRTMVWRKQGDRWQVIAGHMASLDPQGSR